MAEIGEAKASPIRWPRSSAARAATSDASHSRGVGRSLRTPSRTANSCSDPSARGARCARVEDRRAPWPRGLRGERIRLALPRRNALGGEGQGPHEGVFLVGGSATSMRSTASSSANAWTTSCAFGASWSGGIARQTSLPCCSTHVDYPLRSSPFIDAPKMRSAVWMEPRLLAEVSYAEIVDGRLRAPSWRGLVTR